MTVCIAAVCNFGPDQTPIVVGASDRMITIGDLEYEPEQTKIIYMASQTVGLFAGDMQLHASVVPKVMARIKTIIAEKNNIFVEEIADLYAEEFGNYRRKRAEKYFLAPLNLNSDNFLVKQHEMLQEVAFDLTNKMLNSEIASDAIITGIDSSGAHIFRIHDPGVATCLDTAFFGAIGIGEPHASSQFMLAKFEKRWPVEKTLFLTYSAKTLAEAAAGVGKQTDMVVIRPGNQIYALTKEDLDKLDSLLATASDKSEAARQEAYAEIREYIAESAKKEAEAKASADKKESASAPQENHEQDGEPLEPSPPK
jgi:20S proteasome alpha/beta subunit